MTESKFYSTNSFIAFPPPIVSKLNFSYLTQITTSLNNIFKLAEIHFFIFNQWKFFKQIWWFLSNRNSYEYRFPIFIKSLNCIVYLLFSSLIFMIIVEDETISEVAVTNCAYLKVRYNLVNSFLYNFPGFYYFFFIPAV